MIVNGFCREVFKEPLMNAVATKLLGEFPKAASY